MSAEEAARRPAIGFVGLGNMGTPMAANLAAAGYRLTVTDLRVERVRRFVEQYPGSAIGSLPEIGSAASIVITMLPDIHSVRDVMVGKDGASFSMPPGAILIDMSSASPSGTVALGADLAKRGLRMIDAPVSGGVPRAISGELTIMAGGDPPDIDRCESVLKTMGKIIFRTGKLGTGQAMKALNNLCSAAGLLIAAEAIRAGRRFGLDAELMIDILNSSTGQNNSTLRKFKPFILPGKYDSGFGLDLMVKDISAALELAASERVRSPFSKCCVDLWKEAQKTLGPGQDHTAIDLWLARIAEER